MRKSKPIRIGAFSKRFNVSIDTVRFYIENGLLIPERMHNQYVFGEKNVSDMEEILKLKNMRFTIQEMRFLTSLRRLRNLVHNNDLTIYRSVVYQKRQRLIEEMGILENSISLIEEELENTSYNENTESKIGIPLEFLNYLACPECGNNLVLEEATIKNNSIDEGQLRCQCGYKAQIHDGILITDSAIEGDVGFLEGQEGVQRFIEENGRYALLIERAVSWIHNRLSYCSRLRKDRRIILELGTGYGLFMNNYLDSIGNDIYIATELKVSKMRELKQMIEGSGRSPNIVFIATNAARSPLKKECVDIVVDLLSSSHHIKHLKYCPLKKVGEFLRHGGIWVGCSTEGVTPCESKDTGCLIEMIYGDSKPDGNCLFLENIVKNDIGNVMSKNEQIYDLEEDSEVHMKAYMGIRK